MEEFYRGFAQRARDLAESADPFTGRRLLELARRYDLQSKPGPHGVRAASPPKAMPPTMVFAGFGES